MKIKRYFSVVVLLVIINLAISCSKIDSSSRDSSISNKKDVIVAAQSNTKDENKENVVQNAEAKIHFINTGNSDSILIIQGDNSVLIDAGDNDDEGLVSSYIKNQGIEKLTYVVSTHPDADHSGGLDAVLNSISVENLFVSNGSADTKTYSNFINAAADKGVYPSVPLEGSEYKILDNSYIKFYNTNGGSDTNESSLVTLFVNGNDTVLFMGDAGEETENEIRAKLPDVDLVKIGHHGSKTSTTQEFLDAISPEYAVVLTGENNKYGHPSSTTMNKLQNKDIELHRSDECGDIVFVSTGNGLLTSCEKASFTSGDGGNSNGNNTSGEAEGLLVTQTPDSVPETIPVEESASTIDKGNEQMFIISMTGERYHKVNCRTVKQVKAEVTRTEAEVQGYTPCGICKP